MRLSGRILIEASAGTGKTYTLAHLFLRLVLEKALSVDQILVVTFTQAATEELRGRLRQRLRQAKDILEGREVQDDLLSAIKDSIQNRDEALILLTDALTRMDEAAIFTIHSFCQRMLQEHAFESGALFSMEFLESEYLLRRRIMEDFWRLRFYRAPEDETAWATTFWKTPADLLNNLGGHFDRSEVVCLPTVAPGEIKQREKDLNLLFARLQALWRSSGREITLLLQQAREKKIISGAQKNYSAKHIQQATESMDTLLNASTAPWLLPDELILFTTDNLTKCLLKRAKEPVPDHTFFTLYQEFSSSHAQLERLRRSALLQAARDYLRQESTRRKQAQSQLYFDDLLSCLDKSLQAENGQRLAKTINRRFPVILVDEFQDTDPLQYRIFSTIHQADPDSGLFLIGDPKQAIYGFRGADIFTYLKARRDTRPENRLTLGTNYRSSAKMVAAVNWLFDRSNSFIISREQMVFHPVRAARETGKKTLRINSDTLLPLQWLLLPETEKKKGLSKNEAGEFSARFCAHEIAELLKAGMEEKAMLDNTPLVAGDIAVLVRTHNEGELIRAALDRLRIASVYLSRQSVFDTPEAQLLAGLLHTFADPANTAQLRTVLASELFSYTAEQLDQFQHDETRWEEICVTMANYRQLCLRQGFVPMFQQLLAEQQVVGRLLATPSGERKMTNLLQLSELLQEAEQKLTGIKKLLRWLQNKMEDVDNSGKSDQLRLESDENLIKIVTIHKAKGMQYPLVFLPFPWSARTRKNNEPLTFHLPDNPERLQLDLVPTDTDHFLLADTEQLAEDMRLLYVAVTRAEYCCFICWGRISNMERSALCHLVKQPMRPTTHTPETCQDFFTHSPDGLMAIKPYPQSFETRQQTEKHSKKNLLAAHFSGSIKSNWQITSYSRLVSSHDQQTEQPDYDRIIDSSPQTPAADKFGFPRGAAAGTCLHAILEKIDFSNPASQPQVIAEQLQYAGFENSWQEVVLSWIDEIVQTKIHNTLSLAVLKPEERVNEMSFYFPLHAVHLQDFNQLLADFSFAPLPENRATLEGLMIGFIDLVFHYQGRYYLADYKSNHLGNHNADYTPDRLQKAMLEHRYDLQYLIYTLALHRFLGQRIHDYSYENHFGGALYLFLRGMDPKQPAGTGVVSNRVPFALIDQMDHCFSRKYSGSTTTLV